MRLIKTITHGRQAVEIIKDKASYIVSEKIALSLKPRIGTAGRWTTAQTLEQAEAIAKEWTAN